MNNKNIFDIIETHLINDSRPSIEINKLIDIGELKDTDFNMLVELKDIPQEPKYHPEGNVWNHVMLVVDEAAKLKERSEDKRVFMWAALLHDIGKIKTTVKRKGRWTSYNHDTVGAEITYRLLRNVSKDEDFIKKVSMLVKYHMHYLYIEKNLPFAKPRMLLEETSVDEIALLSYADRCGRGELTEEDRIQVSESIDKFKNKLNSLWSLH